MKPDDMIKLLPEIGKSIEAETETLEKEVTILEPQYTIKDDIKFNPYLDYDINDFITAYLILQIYIKLIK